MLKTIITLLAVYLIIILPNADIYGQTINRNIKALFILPENYGANTNLNKDNLENLGWDIVFTGVNKNVSPCPWAATLGMPSFEVDSVLSEIKDVRNYDCVVITSASANVPNPGGELFTDSVAAGIITSAANEGLVVAAYCTTVRVLAKLGLVAGKKITGNINFLPEYESAGAIYQGAGSLPVIDGNIVTSVKGDYFYIQNSDAIENAIESIGLNPAASAKAVTKPPINFQHQDLIWSKLYGNNSSENCNDIVELNDGIFILTGYTYSEGNGLSDLYVKKISPNGDELWTKVIGGTKRDEGTSIAVSEDNIYITGFTTSFGAGAKDIILIKLDLDGNQLWSKYFGGVKDDIARKIIVSFQNEIIICGETFSFGQGQDDLLLLRLNLEGDLISQTVYGYPQSDMAFDITETTQGTFLVSGATGYPTNKRDIWLLEFSSQGEVMMEKFYGDADGNDWGFKVLEYNDNYYIAGKADIHGYDFYNMMLLKVDKNGNVIYLDKNGDRYQYEFGNDFIIKDDKVFLCGVTKSYELSNEISIISTDIESGLHDNSNISQINLSNTGNDWVNKILISKDLNFIIAGETNSLGSGGNDIFVMKLSSLKADFESSPRSGHAPLNINFNNKSFGPVLQNNWDFNNDNIIDSHEYAPSFSYEIPGYYSPSLEINAPPFTNFIEKENYIKVFDGESCISYFNDSSKTIINSTQVINFNDNFTVEMWLKTGDFNNNTCIIDKELFVVSLISSTLYNKECYCIQLALNNGGNIKAYTPSYSILKNDWQHLSIAFQSGSLNVCLNGRVQPLTFNGGELSGDIISNQSIDLTLGNSSANGKNYTGLMDEVRVWNKYRTETEVNSDMQTYLTGNETNLVLYLDFNEGSGNELHGKGNSAAITADMRDGFWEQSAHFDQIASEHPGAETPSCFSLEQNYPNPFNPQTTLSYSLDSESDISLKIYNMLGEELVTLVNEHQSPGVYHYNFNAEDFASGVYIYRLKTNFDSQSKKMILLK